MKNLIFINGTGGVGKTTTSRELQKLLPNCVFLDGDWCWDMKPFVVTEERKEMVEDNIAHLLSNFLKCSDYENVIFCWVMHEDYIIENVVNRLKQDNYNFYKFSLICSPERLKERIMGDVEKGIREEVAVENGIARLKNYETMNTEKIRTDVLSPAETAKIMYDKVYSN